MSNDDEAFGAELVEQDDGNSTPSLQTTPRAQNLQPSSFAQKHGLQPATNNNNNGEKKKYDDDNPQHLSAVGRTGTANPQELKGTSSPDGNNNNSANNAAGGTDAGRRSASRGAGPHVVIEDDGDDHSHGNAMKFHQNGNMLGSIQSSTSVFGAGTQSHGGSQFIPSAKSPQELGSTMNHTQMGNMFLSFSMIPGRKSVMSTNSTVSQIFAKGDRDDEDSQGRATPATGHSSDKDLKDKGKKLPQPVASMGEIEEELQNELVSCVTERTPSCNLSRLQIQRIPQELRCFSWLRELLLGDNNIALLPDTIFLQMQQLEVLDLMENKLVTVPRSVFQLRSLKKILLDHNRIANLPDEIDPDPLERFGLPELVEVGLEWNSLQQFPDNFLTYAPKLERIFLSENPGIARLPAPSLLEGRKKLIKMRLDNRPLLLKAAAANVVYQTSGGRVALEWNKIYPDRVLDFLYLGSMRTAQCVEVYQDLDISYVLTAARNLEVVLGPGMRHLTLPFDDLPGEDISHFFESSFKFIDEAVNNKKGILIHCFAGLSRSVAMTMGYLMKKFRLGAKDALSLVKQSRPSAHPNDGFVSRLTDYQKELGISDAESATVYDELEKRNAKNKMDDINITNKNCC